MLSSCRRRTSTWKRAFDGVRTLYLFSIPGGCKRCGTLVRRFALDHPYILTRCLEDYVRFLPITMLAAQQRFGVTLLHEDQVATLWPGSMSSRPFGLKPPTPCCADAKWAVKKPEKSPLGPVYLHFTCKVCKRKTALSFPASLVGWWMVGSRGHIAYWNFVLPAGK